MTNRELDEKLDREYILGLRAGLRCLNSPDPRRCIEALIRHRESDTPYPKTAVTQTGEPAMTIPRIAKLEKVPYSSIVGQSLMALDQDGRCIAMFSVLNCEQQQQIADQIAEIVNNALKDE